jgi:hypothetical protein
MESTIADFFCQLSSWTHKLSRSAQTSQGFDQLEWLAPDF